MSEMGSSHVGGPEDEREGAETQTPAAHWLTTAEELRRGLNYPIPMSSYALNTGSMHRQRKHKE